MKIRFSDRTVWRQLKLEAWDTERKQWCRVTDLDVDRNNVGLSNGVVRFWRQLDEVKLRTSFNKSKPTTPTLLEKLALEVLESKDLVKKWFRTELAFLGGKTPLEYAKTPKGAKEIERVLRRMEQGIPQ
jgi:hypothetical protein